VIDNVSFNMSGLICFEVCIIHIEGLEYLVEFDEIGVSKNIRIILSLLLKTVFVSQLCLNHILRNEVDLVIFLYDLSVRECVCHSLY
jgi:hypothetical protein